MGTGFRIRSCENKELGVFGREAGWPWNIVAQVGGAAQTGAAVARRAYRRAAFAAGGAWTQRHQSQQARGRRRNATRQFPAQAAVVARRQTSAAGDVAAGTADRRGRWLVRGPDRPALQSAHQGPAIFQSRPASAHGSSL